MTSILMVDDEEDIDILIQQRFRYEIASGVYTFYFARDGREALTQIEGFPHIDIVVTDVNMPQMNGFELLDKIQSLYPHIRTIVVSAYSDDESVNTSFHRGAAAFLIKPLDFKELQTTFAKLIQAT